MSSTLDVREICEEALRNVGAFARTDEQADADELRTAIRYLDLHIAFLTGTNRISCFVPEEITIPIVSGTQAYSLSNYSGSDKVQFPIDCYLVSDTNSIDRTEVKIIDRRKFDALDGSSGSPNVVYIDRLEKNLTLSVHPVPNMTGYSLKLNFQKFSPNIHKNASGVEIKNGAVPHGLPDMWQLYLINKLTALIGMGAVRRIPRADVNDFTLLAADMENKLLKFGNQEHTSQPPITEAYDP
jgi:hypothetical protein